MADRLAALAIIANDNLPALRAIWDREIVELSTIGNLDNCVTTDYELHSFITNERLRIAHPDYYDDFTTWTPTLVIREYIMLMSDIKRREAILKRIIKAAAGHTVVTSSATIISILQAYQIWAKNTFWDSPEWGLKMQMKQFKTRMRQFIRECGWMYIPTLSPPAPAPSALPEPITEPITEPMAEPMTM